MKSTKTSESENGHGNVQDTNNTESNYELTEMIPIEDTPFSAIRIEDKWFLTMGKYRLTDVLPSKENVIENALKTDWTRLMQIMRIIVEEWANEQKLKN